MSWPFLREFLGHGFVRTHGINGSSFTHLFMTTWVAAQVVFSCTSNGVKNDLFSNCSDAFTRDTSERNATGSRGPSGFCSTFWVTLLGTHYVYLGWRFCESRATLCKTLCSGPHDSDNVLPVFMAINESGGTGPRVAQVTATQSSAVDTELMALNPPSSTKKGSATYATCTYLTGVDRDCTSITCLSCRRWQWHAVAIG